MYDIVSGDCVVEVNKAHESDILHIVCLSDRYMTLFLRSVLPSFLTLLFPPSSPLSMFSIATCSADSSIRLWKNRQVNPTLRYESGGSSTSRGIQKAPKLEAICQGEMYVHSEMVNNMLFIEQGAFASCGGDGLVILWKDGALQSEIRNRYAVLSLRQQVQALLEKEQQPLSSSSPSFPISKVVLESPLENQTVNSSASSSPFGTPTITIKGRGFVPDSVINYAMKLRREKSLSVEDIVDDLRSNIGCSESIIKATAQQLTGILAAEQKQNQENIEKKKREEERETMTTPTTLNTKENESESEDEGTEGEKLPRITNEDSMDL
jgi:hypothetical protein